MADTPLPVSTPFRDGILDGRVALITGGGTGLGLEIARHFAALGARVALVSRRDEHLQAGAATIRGAGGEAMTAVCDVRDPDAVQAAVEATRDRFGRIDILVNNAAGNFLVRTEELSPNGWAAVRAIVLDGTFHCSRAVFPAMREQGGGTILNILATYAEAPAPYVAHSGAAKAGVLSLTRTLAVEWAEHGIRVNAIAPGPIDTAGAGGQLWDSDEARTAIRRAVPLARFGSGDDVATMASFLVSDAAGYVTGGLFPVDGGLTLGSGLFDSRFAALMRDAEERRG